MLSVPLTCQTCKFVETVILSGLPASSPSYRNAVFDASEIPNGQCISAIVYF
jgi:hypothetical protein